MNKRLKVLILNAHYGDGHVQVSNALQQCLLDKGISNIQIIDLYGKSHPLIDAVARFWYLKTCSHFPKFYGWIYYKTQDLPYNQIPMKWLNFLGIKLLKEILDKERPDLVITTFPMLAMSELRMQTGIRVPIFTVLTDYAPHDRWFHPETDKYFVATEELKTSMINRGIPAERIIVSGIPIRKAFYKSINKNHVFKTYGLDPQKNTVLVMAGAYGVLQNIDQLCLALSNLKDSQVLVVCGKNQALKEKIEASISLQPDIHILGFIENIHELMAISSCMVTKAGGITLSEALSMQLPVVIFRPIPGQEKENATFLEQKGAALVANELDELVDKVKLMLDGQSVQVKQAMEIFRVRDSSETVVEKVLADTETMGKANYSNLTIKEKTFDRVGNFFKTIVLR